MNTFGLKKKIEKVLNVEKEVKDFCVLGMKEILEEKIAELLDIDYKQLKQRNDDLKQGELERQEEEQHFKNKLKNNSKDYFGKRLRIRLLN